jgi:hypothetical protein
MPVNSVERRINQQPGDRYLKEHECDSGKGGVLDGGLHLEYSAGR